MQGAKEVGSYSWSPSSYSHSSSSSFASELFGSKPVAPSSSSKNVFSSIFPPPPSKVRTGDFPKFEVINARKQYTREAAGWSTKPGSSEDVCCLSNTFNPITEGRSFTEDDRKNNKSEIWSDQKDASRIYQEQNSQPSNLSSSIFYGGQEIYSYSDNNRNSASDPFSLESGNGKDDSGSASRGDWWQGSLYY